MVPARHPQPKIALTLTMVYHRVSEIFGWELWYQRQKCIVDNKGAFDKLSWPPVNQITNQIHQTPFRTLGSS